MHVKANRSTCTVLVQYSEVLKLFYELKNTVVYSQHKYSDAMTLHWIKLIKVCRFAAKFFLAGSKFFLAGLADES